MILFLFLLIFLKQKLEVQREREQLCVFISLSLNNHSSFPPKPSPNSSLPGLLMIVQRNYRTQRCKLLFMYLVIFFSLSLSIVDFMYTHTLSLHKNISVISGWTVLPCCFLPPLWVRCFIHSLWACPQYFCIPDPSRWPSEGLKMHLKSSFCAWTALNQTQAYPSGLPCRKSVPVWLRAETELFHPSSQAVPILIYNAIPDFSSTALAKPPWGRRKVPTIFSFCKC